MGDTVFKFRAHDGAYYSDDTYTFTLTATNNVTNRISTVLAEVNETRETGTNYTVDLSGMTPIALTQGDKQA